MEELEVGISTLKSGKEIEMNHIATEQIKHFSLKAKTWLLQLYNDCLMKLPNIWKKAHTIALLKPGKDPSAPKNFRPISLLSHTYKLFECLIPNRIGPFIEKNTTSLNKEVSTLASPQLAKCSASPSTLRTAMRKGCVC